MRALLQLLCWLGHHKDREIDGEEIMGMTYLVILGCTRCGRVTSRLVWKDREV